MTVIPPNLPARHDEQLPSATSAAEFMRLLREIQRQANLTAGQIAVYSGGKLPRSTAYHFVSKTNNKLPKSREQVEAFCRACRLSEGQTQAVLHSWEALTPTPAPGSEPVVDAELVDPPADIDRTDGQLHLSLSKSAGSVNIAGNVSAINNFTTIVQSSWRWGKKTIAAVVAAVCVVAITVGVGVWQIRPTTGSTTDWASVTVAADKVSVGYSAYDPDDPAGGGRGYLFARSEPRSQRLVAAEKLVYQQNRDVDRIAAAQRQRPLLALIYFGQLSNMPPTYDYAAESEDLEGLALAQHQNIADSFAESPLIRVVLANTGPAISHGHQVAQMLEPLIQHHKEIVGAVGLDQSRTNTITVIQDLTALGVPIIGSGLSADALVNSSPMYFEIAPPDLAVAGMISQYLGHYYPNKNVRLYDKPFSPDQDDLYTTDTVADLTNALSATGRIVDDRQWRDPSAFIRGGTSICNSDILIFAGRDLDFPDFLHTVATTCAAQPVTLLADDSANRFMASTTARRDSTNPMSLIYVTKANLVTCRNHGNDISTHRLEFFNAAADFLRACRDDTLHPLGESVSLVYDAVSLFTTAVQWLVSSTARTIPITSTSMWAALLELPQPIELTSGILHFPPTTQTGQGKVDPTKWQGLMQVGHIWNTDTNTGDSPTLIYGCGSIEPTNAPTPCRDIPH
jgi:hypothetical protein